MPVQTLQDVDPKIKVRHALSFFNNKQVTLATCLGVWSSHVSLWAKEPDEYLQPLHAYRLREKHPGIIQAAADMQAFEDQERADHIQTMLEASK